MKKSIFSFMIIIAVLISVFPVSVFAESNSSYLQKISFFGDSTTHGLIRYIIQNDGRYGQSIVELSRDQVLTSRDGTFYLRNIPTATIHYKGNNLSLSKAFEQASPEILIITVGINGLPTWTQESFLSYYRQLIQIVREASPDTKIALQSVYPTAKVRDKKLVAFTVDKIDRLNQWIQSLAKEQSLPYLDTASVLKGEDGWLIPTYHNGDGLHLNTEGFNTVLDYIINHPIQKG